MSEYSVKSDGHHDLVSPYETPKHSEPVEGHGGTSFENVDARAGLVIWSLVLIAGTLVVVFIMTVGIQKLLQKNNPPGEPASPLAPARVVPPNPQLQVHPWEELPDVRQHEEQVLNGYSRDANGHYHIPIDRAMDAVISQLPIRPDAPQGLTTPGGEGRDFAGSVNSMPAPYRRPQIQGEIRKNAQ
ncbi:MAG: hypothetical protein JO108_21225 [Acidobacteriaceae bacterium]|nr:hypothetical protein [Acidobacteriaceae bacterium]